MADWAREAGRHLPHARGRPVFETCRDQGGLVNARPTIRAGKLVRASLQLPTEDVIERSHAGSPCRHALLGVAGDASARSTVSGRTRLGSWARRRPCGQGNTLAYRPVKRHCVAAAKDGPKLSDGLDPTRMLPLLRTGHEGQALSLEQPITVEH